jgi:hypothetical protein
VIKKRPLLRISKLLLCYIFVLSLTCSTEI